MSSFFWFVIGCCALFVLAVTGLIMWHQSLVRQIDREFQSFDEWLEQHGSNGK